MTDEQLELLHQIVPLHEPIDADSVDLDFMQRVFVAMTAHVWKFIIYRTPAYTDHGQDLVKQIMRSSSMLLGRAEYLKQLETMPYEEYLATPEWQARAAEVKLLRGNRCEKCGSRENLHAHHLTYEHRGHESMSDLQVLCKDCHAREHGRAAAAV